VFVVDEHFNDIEAFEAFYLLIDGLAFEYFFVSTLTIFSYLNPKAFINRFIAFACDLCKLEAQDFKSKKVDPDILESIFILIMSPISPLRLCKTLFSILFSATQYSFLLNLSVCKHMKIFHLQTLKVSGASFEFL